MMPSMILQPIVENCVNHGIREMGDKGKIFLKVFKSEENICITIKDNGKGISKEKIEQILAGQYSRDEDKKDSNGVGMDNVIARLRLFTNNENAIDIVCEGENLGTEIIIRLPMDMELEDV